MDKTPSNSPAPDSSAQPAVSSAGDPAGIRTKRFKVKLWDMIEIPAPGWAITILCVIILVFLCTWGYYKFIASYLPQGNPLASVFVALFNDSLSLTLIILGSILLGAALYLSDIVLRSDPNSTPLWLKAGLFVAFLTSIASFAGAPSIHIAHLRALQPATRGDVLANLQSNAFVHYVIRLIPYTQVSKDFLGIAKLSNLGRCCDPTASDAANQACLKNPDPQRCTQQRFVFVADYAELRGLSVREAVERVGLSLDRVVGVSAIIFPLDDRQLYPANARGVLQVVRQIDHEHGNEPGYKPFEIDNKIKAQEILSDIGIPSYSWNRMAANYKRLCNLVEEFRCAAQFGHPYSATSRFGSLSRDWHPLGLARQTAEDPCDQGVDHCTVSAWADVVGQQIKERQIARVFLIDNYPLASLQGRYMIDYDSPSTQTIIDIGATAATR